MRKLKLIGLIILVSFFVNGRETFTDLINTDGKTVKERFIVPDGFKRNQYPINSFEYYLQNLALKPHGTKVKYYNGIIKPNFWIYDAVVDMNIGSRNLQQCADAVMRLRGEYLYSQKRYNEIHFNFTNGFQVDYSEWMKGNRIVVDGNRSYWKNATFPSNQYTDFRKYMDIIFAYAGTLSLEKELISVDITEIKIGDVFIQGGSPGHAVIVVDLAEDKDGNKIFLLAQSYMPAQDIHILKNQNNNTISPWYSAKINEKLETPEWTFSKSDLKRFK